MKNLKIVVSAFIILLWGFTFSKVDITGKVVNNYSQTGMGFFPILSLFFLLISFVLVWYYLKKDDAEITH